MSALTVRKSDYCTVGLIIEQLLSSYCPETAYMFFSEGHDVVL